MSFSVMRTPFHLVTYSPWPIVVPSLMFGMAVGTIGWFHSGYWYHSILMGCFVCLMVSAFVWWRDVVRESSKMGYHTYAVVKGLRLGVILFITSEVLFFFAFFWGFFHSGGDAMTDCGDAWPPIGLKSLSAFEVPFLNTIVLLSSGVTLTLAHMKLLNGETNKASIHMFFTIFLGVYFTFLQYGEYVETTYNFSDNSFGSIFFIATGFHGLHVIIGSIFLMVCFFRIAIFHINNNHHTGFEAAAWYWHFVDVVWLFLFMAVYWWGG